MQEDEIRKLVRKAVLDAIGGHSPVAAPRGLSVTGRRFITEADVRDVASGSEIRVPPDAFVTPLARDLVLERNLRLVPHGPAAAPPSVSSVSTPDATKQVSSPEKTVALGADHGGFALKEVLRGYLQELGYAVLDCGTYSTDSVDYPDFAYAVARLVSEGRAVRGIMVDGAGIGSCMAANKVPGVRAAMCYDLSTAVNSREHNDANVLTLGARLLSEETMAKVVRAFLTTSITEDRHRRRVGKIVNIERKYFRPV